MFYKSPKFNMADGPDGGVAQMQVFVEPMAGGFGIMGTRTKEGEEPETRCLETEPEEAGATAFCKALHTRALREYPELNT